MVEEKNNISYEEALKRLQQIVEEVRKKELSLEKSLDLLEEAVPLANICVEKIDHTRWQEEGVANAETNNEPKEESHLS